MLFVVMYNMPTLNKIYLLTYLLTYLSFFDTLLYQAKSRKYQGVFKVKSLYKMI